MAQEDQDSLLDKLKSYQAMGIPADNLPVLLHQMFELLKLCRGWLAAHRHIKIASMAADQFARRLKV